MNQVASPEGSYERIDDSEGEDAREIIFHT
jgi:hypothetical protein